jgi:hypothetical protein
LNNKREELLFGSVLCGSGWQAKGYSSVGRAAVSKTAGRKFEPYCPCQFTNSQCWIARSTRLSGVEKSSSLLLLKGESEFM